MFLAVVFPVGHGGTIVGAAWNSVYSIACSVYCCGLDVNTCDVRYVVVERQAHNESWQRIICDQKFEENLSTNEENNSDLENVIMKVDSIMIKPTSISIIIINNNDNEIGYGEEYKIQKNINGEWERSVVWEVGKCESRR